MQQAGGADYNGASSSRTAAWHVRGAEAPAIIRAVSCRAGPQESAHRESQRARRPGGASEDRLVRVQRPSRFGLACLSRGAGQAARPVDEVVLGVR